jgi:hypothetical protein
MILVFQMAKVASRSWMRVLNTAFPERPVIHFHTMSEMSTARIDAIVQETGSNQTIRHMSLPRLGRPPQQIEPFVENGAWVGPPVDIVAGIRDPVARAVSVVGFLTNRLGYTRGEVTVRDNGTAENLNTLFFEVLRVAQGKDGQGEDDHGDTLVRILAHAVFDYRRWFQEELMPAFGIDISRMDFDRDARVLRHDGRHRLLVYRVEDLVAPETARVVTRTAGAFFGREVGDIPADDISHEGRYRALYKEFAQSVRLPEADLSWFYDHPTVEKFYTPREIAVFRRRWGRA